MNKIWKNSNTREIVISIDKPTDGNEYTDETNIANFMGMKQKINMSLEDIHSNINSYISENNELNDYDTKWLAYYHDLYPPSIDNNENYVIDNEYQDPDLADLS